eukprot:7183523-Heterocapsa_arctica.AAC.1
MVNKRKSLGERAAELEEYPRRGQGVAWRFLKIAAGMFSRPSDIQDNEDVLVGELEGDASTLMAEFLYHRTARQPANHLTPMMGKLANPFWSFRGEVFNLRGAVDGSHVHTMLKADDGVCKCCRAILDKGMTCRTTAMAAVLLALFLRSQGFAGFLDAKLSPTSEKKDLLDILGQYKQQRTPGTDRFVERTVMRNGRPLRFCTDLNRYTLADVIGQAGVWLYQLGDLKEQLIESDVVGLLKSGPFQGGYILMTPHVAAGLRYLGRYVEAVEGNEEEEEEEASMRQLGTRTKLFWKRFKVLDDEDTLLTAVRGHLAAMESRSGEDEQQEVCKQLRAITVHEMRGAQCKLMHAL